VHIGARHPDNRHDEYCDARDHRHQRGETSGAVTNALGVDRLDIGAEIAPGVPWTFCRTEGHPIALTLKSGNFGKATFFTDAQEVLDNR
jgi:uncharacterized protein YgbK (DUF1537 family)